MFHINPDLYPILAALLLGFFGFAGGFWAYRKNKADAAHSLVDSSLGLVKEYKESLKECIEEKKTLITDQDAVLQRAIEAEKRAIASEAKVIELEGTVTYLRGIVEEGVRDRELLHEEIGMLETQLEGLGYIPRSKMSRTRSTDKPKKGVDK